MSTKLIAVGVAATLALAVELDRGPHDRALALAAYLDLVCALALFGLARKVGSAFPPSRLLSPARRHKSEPPERPRQLEWLERLLRSARSSGEDVHARLRPLVAHVAAALLARRHGVVLERRPDLARARAGERVWELIRPDRPVPDPRAGGLRFDEQRALIEDLERLE